MDNRTVWPKPDGITMQCIACRRTEVLPWDEAMRVPDPAKCPTCKVPMVAIRGHWRQGV